MARKFETRHRNERSALVDCSSTDGGVISSRIVCPPPGIAASSSPLWVGGARYGPRPRAQAQEVSPTGFGGNPRPVSSRSSGLLLGAARASPVVNRWSVREQLQEPCYLVELLDRGWTQRNALVRKPLRRVVPSRPPPTFAAIQEEVEQLLGNSNRIRDRPLCPDVDGYGYGDEYGGTYRFRNGRGDVRGLPVGKSRSRRCSSVGAVRLGMEDGGKEGSPGGEMGGGKGEKGFRGRSVSAGAEILTENGSTNEKSLVYQRSRSLTDTDLEELQGFLDLGFNFPRGDTCPQVAATLPALRLYHAVETVHSQLVTNHGSPRHHLVGGGQAGYRTVKSTPDPRFEKLDGIQDSVGFTAPSSPPTSEPWMLPSPNEQPANLKLHLRVWAQTVAQTVRQAC